MDVPQNIPAIAAAEAIDRETFRIALGRVATGVTVSSFNALLGPGPSN